MVTKLHTFIFQVTYLIDEAFNVGKGANSIISMLHHFFQTHGIGEKSVHLHADNCAGQNKNRFMMYYLMWRVRTGLHEEVTISFLPVGHTKFSPDWCFGLMKQRFRRTKIGDLELCQSLFFSQCPTADWFTRWHHFCPHVQLE